MDLWRSLLCVFAICTDGFGLEPSYEGTGAPSYEGAGLREGRNAFPYAESDFPQPDTLTGMYSALLRFAQDAYNDRSAGYTLVGAAPETPEMCPDHRADVIRTIVFQETVALSGWTRLASDSAQQHTYAALYKITEMAGQPVAGKYVLSFRGTEDLARDAWDTDMEVWPVVDSICPNNPSGAGRIHEGIQAAYQSVREELWQVLQAEIGSEDTLFLTGHSLGGGLAILTAYDLYCNHPGAFGVVQLYSFAAPALFTQPERLSAIVPLEHRRRAVTINARTGTRDIVVTGLYTFGFGHGDEDEVLALAPSGLLCRVGMCHFIGNGYWNLVSTAMRPELNAFNSPIDAAHELCSACVMEVDRTNSAIVGSLGYLPITSFMYGMTGTNGYNFCAKDLSCRNVGSWFNPCSQSECISAALGTFCMAPLDCRTSTIEQLHDLANV